MTPATPKRIYRFLENTVFGFFGLATIGAVFPAIPGLGEIGSILIAGIGPWITIISVIGAVLVFVRWRKFRRRRTLALSLLTAFAAVGSFWIQAQQIGVAQANGVRVDLVQTLQAGSQADASLKPVTIDYTAHDGKALPLDIYRPIGDHGRGLAPIFIYIHGGGWGAETLKQRQADFRWFAERGYLVISLEYTLSSETQPTWNIAEPQLGCALGWVAGNAASYGGDASRLGLWGESAGGNLVLNVAYRANAGTMKPSCAGKMPQVDAAIALYPVVDPALMYRNDNPLIRTFARSMTIRYTGGTPDQFSDRYTAIASATHITNKAPPTLLIVPESDHLVQPEGTYAFAEQARAAGIDTTTIRIPHAEHSFDLGNGSIGNQLVRGAMLEFLTDHGLAP